VVIEMETEKDIEAVIKNAILIVNKDETLFRYFLNKIYYTLAFLSFIFYYYNLYNISNVLVKSNNESRLIHKKNNGNLLILDNGIKLYNFFFSYETILQFGFEDKRIWLTVFVDIRFSEKSITLLKNDQLSKVHFSFQIKNPEYVIQSLKKNMYYHFKYNKINKCLLKKLI